MEDNFTDVLTWSDGTPLVRNLIIKPLKKNIKWPTESTTVISQFIIEYKPEQLLWVKPGGLASLAAVWAFQFWFTQNSFLEHHVSTR